MKLHDNKREQRRQGFDRRVGLMTEAGEVKRRRRVVSFDPESVRVCSLVTLSRLARGRSLLAIGMGIYRADRLW